MTTLVSSSRPVTTRLNENGRIVIPAALRDKMGVKPGDAVLMEVEDGVLRVEAHMARIRRIQEELKPYAPKDGTLVSDQLIAERREEARREMEDALG
jgi:AbrB family looped-hinge helix DNA binding protein